jgi:hypothetical protein
MSLEYEYFKRDHLRLGVVLHTYYALHIDEDTLDIIYSNIETASFHMQANKPHVSLFATYHS